jgi:hypothetical protein
VIFHQSAFSSKRLFIKAPFHQMAFSSNTQISCSFQNCNQNFCRTSTSKVIDDLVRVTLYPITNNPPIWSYGGSSQAGLASGWPDEGERE